MFMCDGSGAAARGLPVYLPVTEAAADANTFVCEMQGSGSETGVGGGLSGVDLVLTPSGVGAAAGGYRALNGSAYFNATQAALAALLNGDEWTIMWAMRNMAATAQIWMAMLSNGATAHIALASGVPYSPVPQVTTNQNLPTCVDAMGTAEFRMALWRKKGNVHYGIKLGTVWPTGWDSFPVTGRQVGLGGGLNVGAWSTHQKIAGYSSGGLAYDVGTIVISKIGLQAAPV
jgi:hypothetical protein